MNVTLINLCAISVLGKQNVLCGDTRDTLSAERIARALVEIVPKVHILSTIRSQRRSSVVYVDSRISVSNYCICRPRTPRNSHTLVRLDREEI